MMALEHIKVLDLSRRYPAGYATMYLGDFGAQIIKVDPPIPPDDPGRGRSAGDPRSEKLAAFLPNDRNKRSIILNLKTAAGQQVLQKMAKTADVLIENHTPGVLKRLHCDYDTLKEINPRLIYCSCSAFGQDGPYADLPGHNINFVAMGGGLSMIGPRDGPPCFPSNYVGDNILPFQATMGILIALVGRERTGRGQWVDVSYMESAMSVLLSDSTRHFITRKPLRRGETMTTGGKVAGQIYKCKDGEYYTIECPETQHWDNFCRSIGREDLLDKREAKGEERDHIIGEIAQIFLTRTRDEWFEFFKDKNVCSGPVLYLEEAFRDPHVLHRRMVLEFDNPTVGKVRQLGIPIKLSQTPGSVRSLGVPVGANTEEVLREFGYSRADIEELRRQGAFG